MQKPDLGIIIKPASHDCNLSCEYCYYSKVNKVYPQNKHPRMSPEVFDAVCHQYRTLKPQHINIIWEGGEPTLMGLDFFKKALDIETKNARPGDCWGNTLHTNGKLLDDKWCQFLSQNHFLVGLGVNGPPAVNSPGSSPEGTTTSEDIFHSISLLKKYKCEYNIVMIVTQANGDKPEETFNFLLENDLHFSHFNFCTEENEEGNGLTDHSITSEQYAEFQIKLFDAWVQNDDPSFYVRHIDNWLHLFFGLRPEMCEYQSDCSNLVTIEWNGDVYPCDFFVQKRYLMGNILDEPLESILQSTAWKEFTSQAEELPTPCHDCKWLEKCHGGCYRRRKKRLNAQQDNPFFCEANKNIFSHVFAKLDDLKKKPIRPNLYKFLNDIERHRLPHLQNEAPEKKQVEKQQTENRRKKPGRNSPCPCGSGKKYKQCCLRKS